MSSEDTVKNVQIVDVLPITLDMSRTLPTSDSPPSSSSLVRVAFRASRLAGFPDL